MHIQRLIEASPAKAWTLLGLGALAVVVVVALLWRVARSRKARRQRQAADKPGNRARKTAGNHRSGK